MALHRFAARQCFLAELVAAACVVGRISAAQRLFELIEQRVEIGRHELDGADRGERFAIGEPARAEVPAAFGCGTQVSIHLLLRSLGRLRGKDVLAIGLVARCGAVVPVAIEQFTTLQTHDTSMRFARTQSFRAFHPEVVFLLQRVTKLAIDVGTFVLGEQLHHGGEERRLRTAEVVAAVAVGDVTVTVDQEREVLAHRADQIVPAAGLQTEHREIRIPVVHLAKASAGYHIALGQRQATGILDLHGRIAREDGPEPIDVLDDGLALDALIVRRFHLRRVELTRHERFEVEVGTGLFTLVFAYDLFRVAPGDGIDEGLAVGEDALHLNIAEELAIGLGRSRRHRRSRRRRRGTTCEADQHQ